MAYRLGKTVTVGDCTIAVVSRHQVRVRAILRRGLAAHCAKTPAFVVIRKGQGRGVQDMRGAEVAWEVAEALCPEIAAL